MAGITLLDCYKGAKVGGHVGDSIGAPYETKRPIEIEKMLEAQDGLHFYKYVNPWPRDLIKVSPAGRPTDDADQAADLAWSLIECNGLNPEHLREALRNSVIHHKSRLWDGIATGAGETTRNALSDNPAKVAAAMQNNIGTNGSLMRCMPLALMLYGPTRRREILQPYDITDAMSAVTHNHRHAKEACREYSYITWLILDGKGKDELRGIAAAGGSNSSVGNRVGLLLKDNSCFPVDPGAWPARGTAEFSLYAAMWCFLNSTSFADGIEKAVRIGGDTDTYAAIAGGLLGAYYGYEAIPLEWRQTILGHDVMVNYAEKLYEMSQRR